MSTIWNKWGFQSNPFSNQALAANQEGLDLLSGRTEELNNLIYYLENGDSWIPVSGCVGVGKTSLANVASYALYKKKKEENAEVLFIPCDAPISVDPTESNEDFMSRVARTILKSLNSYKSDITKLLLHELDSSWLDKLEELNTWTSMPLTGGKGVGVGGFSASKVTSANTSSGYAKAFSDQVLSLNERIFSNGGGVICIIDNCELYLEARAIVNVLSSLRDDLFLRKGIKWIFCGAYGIVERFTDDRLSSFLSANVVSVEPLKTETEVIEMVNRRRRVFSTKDDAYLPIEDKQISELFGIAGGNPRLVLSKAADYCVWTAAPKQEKSFMVTPPLHEIFSTWKTEQIKKHVADYSPLVTRKFWRIFEKLDALGGEARPSEFQKFECNSPASLANHIRTLKSYGLVDAYDDESNLKKTIYRISEKGRWTMYAWKSSKKSEIY